MKKTDTDKFFEQERLGIFYIRHIHKHSNSVIQPICPQVELRGLGLKAMGGEVEMPKYVVEWVEDHRVVVEAKDRDEAYDVALNGKDRDSFVDLSQVEIYEQKVIKKEGE